MDLATQCTFNNHFEHVYFDDSAKWDAFVSDEKRWRHQNDPIFSSASSTQKESKRKKAPEIIEKRNQICVVRKIQWRSYCVRKQCMLPLRVCRVCMCVNICGYLFAILWHKLHRLSRTQNIFAFG